MPTASKKVLPLQAGVEHELVFASEDFIPQKPKGEERDIEARGYIANLLNDVDGISVDLNIAETKLRAPFDVYMSQWTLPYEEGLKNSSEIDPESEPDHYDLELASPIAKISSTEWIEQTKAIYAAFDKKNITIRAPADTCATHVHISPSNGVWDLGALKAVSMAIIYYERCTDALIHEDHLHSYACKDSNFASVLYQTDIGATQYPDTWRSTMSIATNQHSLMTNLWHIIDECKSTQSIAELLCSHAIGSKKRLPGLTPDSQIQYTRRTEREISRSHRWNFRPLLDESKMEHVRAEGSTHVLGSIEFKQPEGSATAERAIAWRLFAAGFVQAALGWTYEGGVVKEALGWTYHCGVVVDTPTLEELRLFVQGGIVANGCDSGDVDVLFEGKSSAEPSTIEFGNDDRYEEYTVKAADLYDSDDSTGSDC